MKSYQNPFGKLAVFGWEVLKINKSCQKVLFKWQQHKAFSVKKKQQLLLLYCRLSCIQSTDQDLEIPVNWQSPT